MVERRAISSAWALHGLLLIAIAVGPLWLFADSLRTYRLHSDDFAYIGASRTLPRALSNLFVPHNTHIVPAWRLLTCGVVALAGNLAGLPVVLAIVSYGALVSTMLLVGRIAARETGRMAVGFAAMVAMGTTSVLKPSATWYSAGQTLWAAIAILAMLALLQDWRRAGGLWRLIAAALAAWLAGSLWTVGHVAGPVGAMYLWADGRQRCRKVAIVPLLATSVAVLVALALGGRRIDARVSFHGRTSQEAVDPVMGMSHTLQAIPENLVLANLGVAGETTVEQGIALSLSLALAWAWTRRGRVAGRPRAAGESQPVVSSRWSRAVLVVGVVVLIGVAIGALARSRRATPLALVVVASFELLGGVVLSRRGSPLERAGAALVLAASLLEWSFRGYLPFSSLRGVVPWYDTIPQVGAILFAAGWSGSSRPVPVLEPQRVSRIAAAGVLLFATAMLIVHQHRADLLFIAGVPTMPAEEAKAFPTTELQKRRAAALAVEMARLQRRHLARLDRAQAAARRLGIGREGIARALGRVDLPELPKVYDAALMLDLPWAGTQNDPRKIREALGPLFAMEPEPGMPVRYAK